MPNMSPEDVWGQVVEALRAEIGEGAFTSYLQQARVREGQSGDLFLVTPTAYARAFRLRRLSSRASHSSLMRRMACRSTQSRA